MKYTFQQFETVFQVLKRNGFVKKEVRGQEYEGLQSLTQLEDVVSMITDNNEASVQPSPIDYDDEETTEIIGNFNWTRFQAYWTKKGKPFYNVYPSIVPMLLKIGLDIPCESLKLPQMPINVRFPVESVGKILGMSFDQEGFEYNVRNVFFGPTKFSLLNKDTMSYETENMRDGFAVYVDIGEELSFGIEPGEDPASQKFFQNKRIRRTADPFVDAAAFRLLNTCRIPVMHYITMPINPGGTIEDSFTESCKIITEMHPNTITLPNEIYENCIKLCVTLCMISEGGDRDIIEEHVLSKHRGKFMEAVELGNETEIVRLHTKAAKRGSFGYEVGKKYEKVPGSPYIVPPHPCKFWTGKGRTQLVVKTRKGWVARRKQIESVPTGYDGIPHDDESS